MPTVEELRHMYFDQLLSTRDIAAKTGIDRGRVRKILIKNGYKLRSSAKGYSIKYKQLHSGNTKLNGLMNVATKGIGNFNISLFLDIINDATKGSKVVVELSRGWATTQELSIDECRELITALTGFIKIVERNTDGKEDLSNQTI